MTGTLFTLELRPRIPSELTRLEELAADLYFSWDQHTRGIFYYLDPVLWKDCRHNPKVFLRRVSQKRLEEAVRDRALLQEYERTLAYYDVYHGKLGRRTRESLLDGGLVAYFCAEFGLHESLPVYSGGLGILAGDFCKAASDIDLPFVAVGLLYRAGNVTQIIDEAGWQHIHSAPLEVEDLPITPARAPDGSEITVHVELPDSRVTVRAWHARVGHSDLYLLDTDMEENQADDRSITQQPYPAAKEARLRQEIVMGIGGVRVLRALGVEPSVWHINEGHPSLLLLERWREQVRHGTELHAALEVVAAATVFTTHTPVTAGHEVYDHDLIRAYFSGIMRELGIREEEFLALGANDAATGFNVTTFALRCSRFCNGVSRIHSGVAAELEKHVWPEVPIEENPLAYVTNGIHVPTFLAREWLGVLEEPGWQYELLNPEYWQRIDAVPDATFWGIRLSLKAALLEHCRRQLEERCRRRGYSHAQIDAETELLRRRDDVMVIGFARRFAAYKRATLLFEDAGRLERLLNDPSRPVLLIFAGKAHPNDDPGKELIKRIHECTQQPAFRGRVLLLENYDLALARCLVAGCDLWINAPEYPMEASGTSGMKAAINGGVNLGILDGWWAEGYDGRNGWGLQPHDAESDAGRRRWLEAKELLDTLEFQAIPLYFDKTNGISAGWVRMAKASMQSVIPRFNAQRMVTDYVRQFYAPSLQTSGRVAKWRGGAAALAKWKQRVIRNWPGVTLRRVDAQEKVITQGEKMRVAVAVKLNGLRSEDVVVECQVGTPGKVDGFTVGSVHTLSVARVKDGETVYEAAFDPELNGLIAYRLRAYPHHPLLCRRFEMGFMKWV